MLGRIFTISILVIISFMLFAGLTQSKTVAMFCFYAVGGLVTFNLLGLVRDFIDSKSK